LNVSYARHLQLGGGDWTAIFSEPVGNVTYALIVLLIASPFVVGLIRRKRMEPTVQELIEKNAKRRNYRLTGLRNRTACESGSFG
jgi:hypothetical protein